MRAIDRKAVRDLWAIKGQAIAIALVIASGVGTFVMSLNTLQSLQTSKEMYYEKYRFAHIWSHVKRAPMSLARRIETIPGVSQAQLRVVVDVTLDVRSMAEPAIGRLISFPEHRLPMVNDLHVRKGRWIEPLGRPGPGPAHGRVLRVLPGRRLRGGRHGGRLEDPPVEERVHRDRCDPSAHVPVRLPVQPVGLPAENPAHSGPRLHPGADLRPGGHDRGPPLDLVVHIAGRRHGAQLLNYRHGAYFWVHVGYSYTLLVASTVLLVVSYFRFKGVHRPQALAVLLSFPWPWIGNALYVGGVVGRDR